MAKSTKADQMKKKQKLQTSFRVSNNIESVHEQGLKCNIFFNTKKSTKWPKSLSHVRVSKKDKWQPWDDQQNKEDDEEGN